MSARRNFLRNITMAIAASLVPRILQPAVPELPELEEMEIEVAMHIYQFPMTGENGYEVKRFTMRVPENLAKYIQDCTYEITSI
jgi:hypothetical protein